MSSAFSDLIGRLKSAGRLGPEDVRALRAEVYGAPRVTADDVEALAGLDATLTERPPADWGEFLAEACVDYVVRQSEPEDYVDDAKARWLTTVFAAAESAAAIEALTRVLETAAGAPESLERFVLAKAKDRAIANGRVSADDAGVLRRLVFASGGEGDLGVTREEADLLFDINEACRTGANDPAWDQLFAQAIADHLTAVSPFKLPSRERAASDEARLAGREPVGGFMAGMLKTPDVAGALREALHPLADEADEWRESEAQIETAEAAAAVITDDEARWLVGRLGSGALGAAERRLIETLRAQAPQASGLLQPLLGGGAAPAEPVPGVFGHRKAAPGQA